MKYVRKLPNGALEVIYSLWRGIARKAVLRQWFQRKSSYKICSLGAAAAKLQIIYIYK